MRPLIGLNMTAYKNIPSGLENDKNSHADRIDRSKVAQSRKTASLKVEREKENKPPPEEGEGGGLVIGDW